MTLSWYINQGEKRAKIQQSNIVLPWYLAGGIPPPLGAYQADSVANLAASQINLINPGTYDLTTVVGKTTPTWAASTGWGFAGNHGWNTGIIPGENYSAIIRFSNQSNAAFALFGSDRANDHISFMIMEFNMPGVLEQLTYFIGDGDNAPITKAGTVLSGVLGLAGWNGWRNNASDGSKANDWSGTSTYPIYIGGSNHAGVFSNAIIGNVQRFAVWDSDISSYWSSLYAAILI